MLGENKAVVHYSTPQDSSLTTDIPSCAAHNLTCTKGSADSTLRCEAPGCCSAVA